MKDKISSEIYKILSQMDPKKRSKLLQKRSKEVAQLRRKMDSDCKRSHNSGR